MFKRLKKRSRGLWGGQNYAPHGTDTRRRPRHDERAPLQRRPLRQERDHVGDAEDHLFRAAVLDDGAVVDGFDAEVVRIRDGGLRHEDGADGGGGVEACEGERRLCR